MNNPIIKYFLNEAIKVITEGKDIPKRENATR